ncbi:MAG TPA: 50S ribosomal protein L23 [Acidimicrobiales bacterium]|jgi:large subunit ribosomal protein L23
MTDPRDVILRPVVSEKSYGLLDHGVYTFIVRPDANKIEIRHAVETIFDVTVVNVNTLNRKGKRKRQRKKPVFGKRADTKRAIVTLAEGDRIPLFESA